MDGRKRRTGLIAGLALLSGVLVLGLLVRGTTRAGGSGRGGGPARAAASAADPTALAAATDHERDGVELVQPWDTDDVAVRPGVRLPGPGKLTGVVRERGSGAGVGGIRLDLLPITPSAEDALGAILRLARTDPKVARSVDSIAVTTSAADGSFSFTAVRRGTYFLDARGPYHVPDHLEEVRVTAAGDGGPVDAWVRRGGRVVGVVQRPDGSPVAGAEVCVFHGPGTVIRAFRAGDLRRLDTRTDRSGAFAFSGVSPGEGYEVHAIGAGFAVTHQAVPPVRAGEDAQVRVVVRAGVTITGRVLASNAAPGAEAGAPVPLAGAELAAIPRGLRDLQFAEEILQLTHCVSGADGSYELHDVPPGDVEIVANAPGYVSGRSQVLRTPPEGSFAVPDLVLRGGPVVRGRVVDAAGQPLAGVMVRWFLAEVPDPNTFDFTFAALIPQAVGSFHFPITDADGRFQAGPFPGETPYHFYCSKEGYEYQRVTWEPAKDGEEVQVVLSAGGTVEGIVMDARAAKPVTSFVVSGHDRISRQLDAPSAWNPFSGGEVVEDPQGRFRIEGVAAGDSKLAFNAPGYQPAEVDLHVTEGQETKGVIVKLVPGGDVRGRVTDAAGQPVAGATVGALSGAGWSPERAAGRVAEHMGRGRYADTNAEEVTNAALSFATRMGFLSENAVSTDQDGRYLLRGVAPGPFTVVVRHRDYALGESAPLTMPEGQSLDGVDLQLSHGASLFGRVTDRFDRPLPGSFLLVVSPSEFSGDGSPGAAVYEGIADENGDYEIQHLLGGGYFVGSMRADAALNPATILGTFQFDLVDVPAGQRVRHDVVDRSAAACHVYGTVTSGGEPVTEGGLIAVSFEGDNLLGMDVKATRIAADSSYEFPGLAPGSYEIAYQGDGQNVRLKAEIPDLPDCRLDLSLPSGGASGRVIDDATGAPIEGCRISLGEAVERHADGLMAMFAYYGGRGPRASTDADGRFSFSGQEAGSYILAVDPPHRGPLADLYARASGVPLEIAADRLTTGIEVRLTRALALRGLVTADGQPLEGALVVAHTKDGPPVPAARDRTDAQGRFALTTLSPGTYELSASAEGFAESAAVPVTLGDQPIEDLEIPLEAGRELHLTVRWPDGRPAPGAVAVVFDASGRPVLTGKSTRPGLQDWFTGDAGSDSDGHLFVGRLLPGTYRVEVRCSGSTRVLDGVKIADDPRVDLDVVLP